LKNGELKIAIFGAGGTGKSTLGKLLSGEFELSGLLQTYGSSVCVMQWTGVIRDGTLI
jgi:ABC-type transport system involved in cytochrome bd biosynthesis fused ATPase/permease subunit